MISADYYQIIYLTIVSLLTFVTCHKLGNKTENTPEAILLCIFIILFIGFRPLNGKVFVDMGNYVMLYTYFEWNGFNIETDNIIFDNLFLFLGSSGVDITYFFVLIATIYFGCMLIACKMFFPNNTLLAFLVCLAAFSTFSYGTNGIKAGAASSIFLVALAYGENLLISIPLALISWGFHHSMQLPVAAYIIALIFKNEYWYFRGWCVCVLFSLLHVTFFQSIFAGWTDEQGAGYLNVVDAEFVSHKGFRFDFVIYSAFPVIMGYYATVKYKFKDKIYGILLRTYTLSNSIWMLCMYAPYNNRIAYLSWFIYPIVLIYPCMKKQKFNHQLVRHRNMVVGLHLSFTLFMFVVYYGIFGFGQ